MQQADTEVLDNEVEEEIPEPEGEEVEQTAPEGEEAASDDDVVITIGDEEAPTSEEDEQPARTWVRELRKKNQETVRENRELKKQLEQAKATPVQKPTEVGVKPTLESCEYDSDRYERDLEQWHERKRTAEAEDRKKQDDAKAGQDAWNAKLSAYGKQKSELKVRDYEEIEAQASENLSVTQQGIIVSGADNPAVVIYALGKNPNKLKELASITDPVKFAFAIAKLETQMKVTPRKSAPLPESTVRGSASSGAVDNKLERLRAEADKSGDRTKVAAYMRDQKSRSKSK